ncbi:SUMF1/EgtB/PvdO family nonheme iron enzyme [Arthrobacter sp. H14]|uniref:SUMF1/EgtB/PvdO family nonheme iron enzyme n=1 Tax=Arthrobacter sp. H14 TaxID=1312959 RepID=UPI001C1E60A7
MSGRCPRPRRRSTSPPRAFAPGPSAPWDWSSNGDAHEVHVPGFWIDTVPVSNAEFAQFGEDGGYDRRQ